MAKKLLLTAICLLVLPVFSSPSSERGQKDAVAFQSVVFAGRTLLGGWCQCGSDGCFCDPGEQPGGNSATSANPNKKFSNQGTTPASAERTSGFDFGSGALMLALAFFLWTRLRG
ncbi:MAG: hypothetical protein AABO41_28395 [Acidobacteriota bacterium]